MIPLAAEPIFHLGSFPVTNALLNGWIACLFFILVAVIASRRTGLAPKGIHNFFEALVEGLLDQIEKVTESRPKAMLFFPLVTTIFLFVLFSNWLGLMPGTGTIGIYGMMHGQVELIPLLRPATSDLNLTLAIALLAVLATHVIGMKTVGITNHLSKFINIRGVFRALKKGPLAVFVACIELFVGLLETIGEFAKTLSLSLRLFGNVFAGEILITVMMSLLAYILPIPFIFLEILVGLIQATVFAILVLVYLTVATSSHDNHEQEGQHANAH